MHKTTGHFIFTSQNHQPWQNDQIITTTIHKMISRDKVCFSGQKSQKHTKNPSAAATTGPTGNCKGPGVNLPRAPVQRPHVKGGEKPLGPKRQRKDKTDSTETAEEHRTGVELQSWFCCRPLPHDCGQMRHLQLMKKLSSWGLDIVFIMDATALVTNEADTSSTGPPWSSVRQPAWRSLHPWRGGVLSRMCSLIRRRIGEGLDWWRIGEGSSTSSSLLVRWTDRGTVILPASASPAQQRVSPDSDISTKLPRDLLPLQEKSLQNSCFRGNRRKKIESCRTFFFF